MSSLDPFGGSKVCYFMFVSGHIIMCHELFVTLEIEFCKVHTTSRVIRSGIRICPLVAFPYKDRAIQGVVSFLGELIGSWSSLVSVRHLRLCGVLVGVLGN